MTVPEVALLAASDTLVDASINSVIPNKSSYTSRNCCWGVVNYNATDTVPEKSGVASDSASATKSACIESRIPGISLWASGDDTGNYTSKSNQNIAAWASIGEAWCLNASTDGNIPSKAISAALDNITPRVDARLAVPDEACAASSDCGALKNTTGTELIVSISWQTASNDTVIVVWKTALTIPEVSRLTGSLRCLVKAAGEWGVPVISVSTVGVASVLGSTGLSIPEPSVGAGRIKGATK